MAPLVVLIGILALVQDSWPRALLYHGQFHALFGALLWIGILMRFYAFQNRPQRLAAEVRAFSRDLLRRVYLLLYLLMLLRLLIWICRNTLEPVRLMPQDFQVYLAFGGMALVTIRLLAALSSKRPAEVARTRQAKAPRPIDRLGDADPGSAHHAGRRAFP